MSAPHGPRVTAPLGLVAAVLLLAGCGADTEVTALRESLSSTEERLSSAEARIETLEDEVDRIPDAEAIQSQAGAAVSSAADRVRDSVDGLRSGAEGAARDAVDSLPQLPDAQAVERAAEDGRMMVEFAQDSLPQDPAELERALQEAADAVRERVPGQGEVEFRVGDRSFTF